MPRILFVEDESELREEVTEYLIRCGHQVDDVQSARQFWQYYREGEFDIVLLDRMLPDGDGLDIAAELRGKGARCGIMMFTARDSTHDRIDGFQSGVDHYLNKPVRLEELEAIIGSLIKRLRPDQKWVLALHEGCLVYDQQQRIRLTHQECLFLEALNRQPCKPLSRAFLIEAIGKDPASYDPRSLDAMVMRLRKKVGDVVSAPFPLQTAHGSGYLLPTALD